MHEELRCYRCGESLAALTLPISRQDQCPSCGNYVHVCRMCVNFDPYVARQCREDDAEEVFDKEKPNFCDWYVPSADAFDGANKRKENKARSELSVLFGEAADGDDDGEDPAKAAENLFG